MSLKGKRVTSSSTLASQQCVFCRIISRRAPSHIIYEDELYIAFLDKSPFSIGHTLVCPKKHGETVWDMDEVEIGGLFRAAAKVSKALVSAVGADGFRFVQNNGEAADQVVAHVHVHVIPVKMEDRGKYMHRMSLSPEEMEQTTQSIRERLKDDNRAGYIE
jgi:histidine triad (HIT) family protein